MKFDIEWTPGKNTEWTIISKSTINTAEVILLYRDEENEPHNYIKWTPYDQMWGFYHEELNDFLMNVENAEEENYQDDKDFEFTWKNLTYYHETFTGDVIRLSSLENIKNMIINAAVNTMFIYRSN